jgi:acetylornithine deacetylase/succinyl-diaminopimelate desuccinylase-like protein
LLGVDTLLVGWGQNSDNLHSPDEHFAVDSFRQGTRSSACLWHHLAQVARG